MVDIEHIFTHCICLYTVLYVKCKSVVFRLFAFVTCDKLNKLWQYEQLIGFTFHLGSNRFRLNLSHIFNMDSAFVVVHCSQLQYCDKY